MHVILTSIYFSKYMKTQTIHELFHFMQVVGRSNADYCRFCLETRGFCWFFLLSLGQYYTCK